MIWSKIKIHNPTNTRPGISVPEKAENADVIQTTKQQFITHSQKQARKWSRQKEDRDAMGRWSGRRVICNRSPRNAIYYTNIFFFRIYQRRMRISQNREWFAPNCYTGFPLKNKGLDLRFILVHFLMHIFFLCLTNLELDGNVIIKISKQNI